MSKIIFYKFFFSLFLLVLFLYPASVSAQLLEPASCYGLRVDAGPGDERDRCYQASSELASLISCLGTRNPNLIITSIGDDPSFFEHCVTNWTDDPCNHRSSSDHYGGRLIDGGRSCVGSHAIDLRAANLTQANPIIQQVTDCGGKAVFESGPGAPHVHASVGNCGGSGGAAASVYSVTKKIEPICFKPTFPIPGFTLNDANDASCPGGKILSSKGDAIIVYINALYKYGAGLAGLMAMFMIVFAAWQWIMASGNAGKIDNAKETIRGALLGLTLLFAGNLLLSNITTRLVQFDGLNIKNIDTIQLQQMSRSGRGNSCANFDTTRCAEMSALSLCEWITLPNGISTCDEKQGSPLSYALLERVYQASPDRLICCTLSDDDTAGRIGVYGGTNRNCEAVFDQPNYREISKDICLNSACSSYDTYICSTVSYCSWNGSSCVFNF